MTGLRSTTAERLAGVVALIAPSAEADRFTDITDWIEASDIRKVDPLRVEEIGWLKGYCEALNGTIAEVLDGFDVSVDPKDYK